MYFYAVYCDIPRLRASDALFVLAPAPETPTTPPPPVVFNFGPQDEFLAGLDQTIASGQAMLQAGKDLMGMQDSVIGDETQDRKRSATEATEQDLAKLIGYFPFRGQRTYIRDQKFNGGGERAQYQAINQILNKKLAEYPEGFQTRILALPTIKEKIEVLFDSARFREVLYREEPEGKKKQKPQDDDDDLEQSMQDTMGVWLWLLLAPAHGGSYH